VLAGKISDGKIHLKPKGFCSTFVNTRGLNPCVSEESSQNRNKYLIFGTKKGRCYATPLSFCIFMHK